MTTMDPSTPIWNTMPGWGISTNLLPPEVLAQRRVNKIRKVVFGAVAAVVVGSAGLYGYATYQASEASTGLESAQARTSSTIAQQSKYSEVLAVQAEQGLIEGKIASLMAKDVDVAKVLRTMTAAKPGGTTLTQLAVTLTSGTDGRGSVASGGDVLDGSGHAHIGSVVMAGQARTMKDVATYASSLSKLPGVASAYPNSQQITDKTVQFSLQITLNDQLISARPVTAASTPGGK